MIARIAREIHLPISAILEFPCNEIDYWIEIYKSEEESTNKEMRSSSDIKSFLRGHSNNGKSRKLCRNGINSKHR